MPEPLGRLRQRNAEVAKSVHFRLLAWTGDLLPPPKRSCMFFISKKYFFNYCKSYNRIINETITTLHCISFLTDITSFKLYLKSSNLNLSENWFFLYLPQMITNIPMFSIAHKKCSTNPLLPIQINGKVYGNAHFQEYRAVGTSRRDKSGKER